ncbi:MAG TPA: NCS2 family permease [Symbiobacteriaceae bacterium]|nr:NCS2 family permease [Symbiobacteriaceae bacterium]
MTAKRQDAPVPQYGWAEKFFALTASKTTVKTELLAGLTTFMTMAYILFVNPDILGTTGMNKEAVLMATAIASAAATLVMGLYANLPFALAPGMGMNAFFAFTAVAQMGLTWQVALAAVFMDGVICLLLTILPIRERIIREIPMNIKLGVSIGIGLFIAFIGLVNAGIVVKNDATAVSMGDLTSPGVLLSIGGLILMAFLLARKVKGALVIGILATTIIGFFVPGAKEGTMVSFWPGWGGLLSMPSWETFSSGFLQLDFSGLMKVGLWTIIFTFTFVDLFDTVGTFSGLATRLGWIDKTGSFPRAGKGLIADSTGSMIGGLVGTSSTTTYVESAAGIAEGGRTGLTAVTVAVLFLLCLFIAPLATIIPGAATAPALILVGFLMLEPITLIKLDDITEAIPAFLAIIMMPLTYSIANGLIWSICTYAFLKTLTGKWKDVTPLTWILTVLFLISIIWF